MIMIKYTAGAGKVKKTRSVKKAEDYNIFRLKSCY